MLRKILIATVATAAIGTAALAPTAASAGWHRHGPFIGIGFFGEPDYAECVMQKQKVLTDHGWRWRWVRVCE